MLQPFKCPNTSCGATLRIDGTTSKKVKCPKCDHVGTLDSYIKLRSTQRQCLACDLKWEQYHKEGATAPMEYICPKCSCIHFAGNDLKVKTGKCPNGKCQSNDRQNNLSVKFAIDSNYKPSTITCAHCKTKAQYEVFVKETPPPPRPKCGEPDTRGADRPIDNGIFNLEMVCDENIKWYGNSRVIELKEGLNVIGRSPRHGNPIALPSNDTFMSKEHICIKVSRHPKKHFYEHVLTDISKNGTFLNYRHERISKEAVYFLQENDRIKIGYTTFVVRRKS